MPCDLSLAHVATAQSAEFSDEAEEYLRRAERVHGIGSRSTTADDGNKLQKPTIDWSMLQKVHAIQLLQEADEFVVVSKPSGMVCYHSPTSTSSAAKRNSKKKRQTKKKDASLEDCLLRSGVPLSTLNKEGQGMVHRIDRGTSGCIVLAKTNRMHSILMAQFFLRNVSKSYQALICTMPNNKLPTKGTIDLDIDGRPAISKYRVEQKYADGVARIKVKTKQGRRHQVWIHCSRGLQAPILLDSSYGGGEVIMSKLKHAESALRESEAAKRFCLHADRLSIPGQGIEVTAALPEWWRQLEEELLEQ
jgi:23S rRNA-/tRNA-specific pseudouridylate synthase